MTDDFPDPFPFDIVGFDLDGTLLDTEADLGAAVNHALALAGRPPVPAGQTRALIGGGGKKMLARALEQSGDMPDDAEFVRLYDALIAFYEANIIVHTRPFAGCLAALDNLAARGVRLAVVTNKLERLAVRSLVELGMADRFLTIIGGDTLGPGSAKPAPDQLHEMIVRCGGGRAAYVGDTTYDTRAAAAAGIPCVAVEFGYCDAAIGDLGATRTIAHFDMLAGTLRDL